MPKRKKTDNFYASEARIADRQNADKFICERWAEGLYADVRPIGDEFFGLVLAKADADTLLEEQCAAIAAEWAKHFKKEPPPEMRSLDSRFFDQPEGRRAPTRMEALEASHQAYLGKTALEFSAEQL